MRLARKAVLASASILLLTGAAHAQMRVHFINVGQAESILLEFETAAVLIDAGGEDTVDNRDRDRLIGYLTRFFDRRPPRSSPRATRPRAARASSTPSSSVTRASRRCA